MQPKRQKLVIALVATAAATFSVALAQPTWAFFVRQSAVGCVPLADSSPGNSTIKATPIHPDGYLLFAGRPTSIYCAYPETDTAQKFNLTSVNVHAKGHASTSKMQTQACIGFWNASGGSCGGITTTQGLNLDQGLGLPSVWSSNDGHFAFLRIGNQDSPGDVFVKGIFYSN